MLHHLSTNKLWKKSLLAKYKHEKHAKVEVQQTIVVLNKKLAYFSCEKHFLQQCETFLSPSLSTIVNSCINCQKRKLKDYQNSNKLKQLVLIVYFLGLAVYSF